MCKYSTATFLDLDSELIDDFVESSTDSTVFAIIKPDSQM
jgi:hypothetical protein